MAAGTGPPGHTTLLQLGAAGWCAGQACGDPAGPPQHCAAVTITRRKCSFGCCQSYLYCLTVGSRLPPCCQLDGDYYTCHAPCWPGYYGPRCAGVCPPCNSPASWILPCDYIGAGSCSTAGGYLEANTTRDSMKISWNNVKITNGNYALTFQLVGG
jgi:hypothetical protein